MGVSVGDTVVVLAEPYTLATGASNCDSFSWMRHRFTVLSMWRESARIESEDRSVTKVVPADCLAVLPEKSLLSSSATPASCALPYKVGDIVTGLGCRYVVAEVFFQLSGKHTYKLEPHRVRTTADGRIAQDFYWQKDEWSHSLLDKVEVKDDA